MVKPEVIAIVPYRKEYAVAIKELNYEWLLNYFSLEPGDIDSLNNPESYILDKGGYIFFALFNGIPVGTVSLLKTEDSIFELSKMAVASGYRGKGIGNQLMEYCLEFAVMKNFSKLILYSNTKLESAIRLYRKYGFYEVPLNSDLYKRANIKMEKVF